MLGTTTFGKTKRLLAVVQLLGANNEDKEEFQLTGAPATSATAGSGRVALTFSYEACVSAHTMSRTCNRTASMKTVSINPIS